MLWKPELYKIQLEAPRPKKLIKTSLPANGGQHLDVPPPFYGLEYHGNMSHKDAAVLLRDQVDGTYLVRKSPSNSGGSMAASTKTIDSPDDYHTLSVRFNGTIKNFKVFFKEHVGHYVKENKTFDTIDDLVADGLLNFHMDVHAVPIMKQLRCLNVTSFEDSPYMTLNRGKLERLRPKVDPLKGAMGSVEAHTDIALITPKTNSQNVVAETSKEQQQLPAHSIKSHNFKVHTFKGLNWCEVCAHFLWGFTCQGVKCEDCGFVSHNKCSELVPAPCVPALMSIRGIFGIDLTATVKANHCRIPFVVAKCVEEIERSGMLQEGIYRVSGFADEIEVLKSLFDKEGDAAIISADEYNINAIAGVLKLYLRLLPVPLITFDLYSNLMEATSITERDQQIQELRVILKRLPEAHWDCLRYVCNHLFRVSAQQDQNKMTESNLATVFAPTLIGTDLNRFTDFAQEIMLLTTIIQNCNVILP